MRLQGIITKIPVQKENDWGRYEVDLGNGETTIAVGIIPAAGIGSEVTLDGSETTNAYGKQFQIKKALSVKADKLAGVRKFFADGYISGIGEVKGNLLVNKFGKKALDMFETQEGRNELASSVKGLGRKTIETAHLSYLVNKKYLDLVIFLNGMGTKKQVSDIFTKYGVGAIAMLKRNPYKLQAELDGFGFMRADAIAMAAGIKANSKFRLSAAISYVLTDAAESDGHCYLTEEQIYDRVLALLAPIPKSADIGEKAIQNALADWEHNREKFIAGYDPSTDLLDEMGSAWETKNLMKDSLTEAIEYGVEENTLIVESSDGETRYYTKKMYDVETEIAANVLKMLAKPPIRKISDGNVERAIKAIQDRKNAEMKAKGLPATFELTEEQIGAIRVGAQNRIGVISGGPGRGKTTICEAISEAFLSAGKQYDKDDVVMLAPTGRAAQRIKESTGYQAMTAHRAILSAKSNPGLLQNKLVICDEWSMADVYLMNNFMKAVQESNVIFIGDVFQIASVGPGKVLRDLIDSKCIPCQMLLKGHRNSGTIAKNADRIRVGMKMRELEKDGAFMYFPFQDHDQMLAVLVNDYIANVKKYGIEEVMLCTATKERGSVSVSKLNTSIQAALTAKNEKATYGSKTFHVGDRVMFTKNNYDFLRKTATGELVEGLFNGERGIICKILPDPELDSYKMIVRFDDGSFGGFTKNSVEDLVLAYATTMHKCQGSEAKCVMVANTFSDWMLLIRSLFYTGVTRAKTQCLLYGEEKFQYGHWQSVFDRAISNDKDIIRQTRLKERLNPSGVPMIKSA